MKKKVAFRIILIGLLHSFLYIYLVPFVIYPEFGNNGLIMAVIVAILISVAMFATMFIAKK